MMPIIEQAGKHHRFISKQLYLYNTGNPLQAIHVWKSDKIKVITDFIYSKPKYQPLTKPPYLIDESHEHRADVIVFNSHGPEQLFSCLGNISGYVQDIAHIFVIYDNHANLDHLYKDIIQRFPHIRFIAAEDLFEPFLEAIEMCTQSYVVVCSDLSVPKRTISLNRCIDMLIKTNAYAFYLDIDKASWNKLENKNALIKLSPNISALQFGQNKELISNAQFMNIYRKTDIRKKCSQQACRTFLDLKANVLDMVDPQKVGLCSN